MRVQRTNGAVPRVVRLGATAAGLALLAGTAEAQTPRSSLADARWRAFAGCWAPGSDSATPLAENAPVVCVAPDATGASAEMVAMADGKVVARERVVVTGERVPAERDGCRGWEQASWSADGHRLFRKAEYTCANGVKRVTQGVFAIGTAGEWLDIRGAGTGASAGVIAIRYRPTANPAGLPADLAAAIPGSTPATFDARAFAAAALGAPEIVEASKQLDPAVLATLLVERGHGFDVSGKMLAKLADAGVSSRVIDAMVALSYPKLFAINRSGAMPDRRVTTRGEETVASGRTIPVYMDPFGWSPYGGYYGYGYGSPYALGYGRYSPYGGGYWGPWGGGFYGNAGPIIVVRPQEPSNNSHGRVVNGRGYTRSGGGGDAGPRVSGDGGYSRGGSSGGGASSGGGGGGGGGGDAGGRTAKPRGGN